MSEPSAALQAKRAKWLRILAFVAVAPSTILVLVIAVFVARAEIAHSESSCPFADVEEREVLAGIVVLDQMRQCQEGVEEHRWIVLRGDHRREIGRRRLHRPYYTEGRYRWTSDLREGYVHIDITNDGTEPAHFREGPE